MEEKKEIILCPCGVRFIALKVRHRKYCSFICGHKYQKQNGFKKGHINYCKANPENFKLVLCKECNQEIKVYKKIKRVFCSRKCKATWQSKNIRENKHPNWKAIKKNSGFKDSVKWKEWRKQVFERDNYTCQYCKQLSGSLEPHHLKSKQCFPELVYNIENGITLCKKCHRLLHKLKPSSDKIKIEEFPLDILNKGINYA